MDIHSQESDPLLMAKRAKKVIKAEPELDAARLYVGEWISAKDKKPREVSKKAPINEGYLSSIISGTKKNPSRPMLARIANYIGVKVSDFDRPPPPKKLLEQLAQYDEETIVSLLKVKKNK